MRARPLPERAAAGFTVYPLDLVSVEHRSRGRVNAVLRGNRLLEVFEPGDPVLLAPVGRPDEGWAARVEGMDASTVELRVEGVPDGKGPWALSRRLDTTLIELQKLALARADATWSPLKNLLLGFEAPYVPDPLDHPALKRLDTSQRIAAAAALGATELGLVHGPPGTGKTNTLVAMLEALVDLGERPWALAETNRAVDLLATRAALRGLDVVRLGVSARIGSEVKHLTLEHRILHGARAKVIERLSREATRATGAELDEVRTAIREEWQAAKREVLASAQVVAMTVGTLHTRGGDLAPTRTAVVDEAGQLTEPAMWTLVGRVRRIILVGDPQQLGPVVKSRSPVLERSLLARLVDEGFHFPMLTTQYRMHRAIQAVVAPTYGGRLEAHPSVADADLAGHGEWSSPPAQFLDTAGLGFDEQQDVLGSYYNPGELRLVARIWAALREAGIPASRVAVVTPYAAQLDRLRTTFPELESGTVNAFQGRERDVVIATFVRSNADGDVGFVADPRRLNVSVSRARRLFIGIGDAGTLGTSPVFQRLIDRIAEGGGYRSAWELEP